MTDDRRRSEPRPDPAAARPDATGPEDSVAETSEESFPASDPPSWTPVGGTGEPQDDAHAGEDRPPR